jgi:uncharacterized protein (TIGR02266 family)
MICPACQKELPDDSRFCGLCGFRLAPITGLEHSTLSEELIATKIDQELEPVPLARAKGGEMPKGPRLIPVEPQPEPPQMNGSLEDTLPGSSTEVEAGPRPAVDALEDTSPSRREQRAARRFPLKVEVNYTSEHNFYTGFMENVSSGGLFVATHEPVTIGDSIEVTFTVPGLNHTCTSVCEVRWIREYNPDAIDTVPGMGLKFTKLDPEARTAIELFIRHREPIFFDDEW